MYTERQISNLLYNDRTGITILCNSVSKFGESETERFQVMGKYEIYNHRNEVIRLLTVGTTGIA
ncbi:hypothetical protein [Bacillus sp. 166amftsu]|uniref:hypothetical protein n=1 Tax=Bacillus sp. 166amftsu TaxID=1761753 RepID=UPI0032AE830E